ncbi:MAG: T9SS type A sorting domain-containing protein [Saprospiraceae bacterium]|nr:T9SS type A sorting domain-containing protein [Candidatus Vicinibacter affinis]
MKNWIYALACILAWMNHLEATHIVGGDMTYRCLGNNQYEISLTVRRDCLNGNPGAQFDDPAAVGIFDSRGFLVSQVANFGVLEMNLRLDDTLNDILDTRCGLNGGDVCVHTTTYKEIVTLPFRDEGYILAYQRCCRNYTIVNIVDPLTVGSTFSLRIREEALSLCNSSPILNNYPPTYICGGTPIDFNLKATDPEGDSLVYSLCNPLTGANQMNPRPSTPSSPPYDPVIFKAPYSLVDMIGGNPVLKMDARTGRMTGFAVNNIAQYLVAYCVKEYRDGVLISELQREFQINVRNCMSVPVAEFDVKLFNCQDPVHLELTDRSTDAFSNIVSWNWRVSAGPTIQNSTLRNPVFNLPDSGTGTIRLVIRSKEGCQDTLIKPITFNNLKPAFFADSFLICRGDSIQLLKNPRPGVNYEWTPSTGLSCNTCPNPTAFPSVTTTYYLMSMDTACSRSDKVTVQVKSCILDSCAVSLIRKCLPGGSVEITALNHLGVPVQAGARSFELFWDIKANATQSAYSIINRNPIVVQDGRIMSLTSKIYSWPKGVPKSIEYALICQRRITDTINLNCTGPCKDFNLVLSSCEDDYDKKYNLNFPPAICQSICKNECNYTIALFELNGQLIDPTQYQIKWSNGATGSYVMLMGPYYDNLSVEVRKGDCVWYGRYIRSCKEYKFSFSAENLVTRSTRNNNDCFSTLNTKERTQSENLIHFSIQPNPFKEQAQLLLRFDQQAGGQIEVFDLTGLKLWSHQIPESNSLFYTIDLGTSVIVHSGIYMVCYTGMDGKKKILKLVKGTGG